MSVGMRHYINGIEVVPANSAEIGLKMSWGEDSGATVNELNVESILLAGQGKKLVLDHLFNSVGFFEGIPYTIKIDSIELDYFIYFTETPRISGEGDSTIEVKVRKRKSWSHFKENADNLSFEAINKTHAIPTIETDYVIVKDNRGVLLISALIATYVLVDATIDAVLKLASSVGDIAKAAIPIAGVGVTGPTLSYDVAGIAWASSKALLRLVYLALVVLALIDMISRIIELIFPRVRQLKSATVLSLIETGCAKLGYTFQSSILQGDYKPLTIVPVPIVDGSGSVFMETFLPSFASGYTKGYPTANDTTKTLGSLIDAMIDMFNGKILIENGVVKLERRDFWLNASSKKITNTLNLQGKRENEWTYNVGDTWKRAYLHYQVDHSDIHTLDNFDGTDCEYSTEPINVNNADLVDIKGLNDINIPFSLGTRKGDLDFMEEFVKALAGAIDFFTDGDSATSIDARKSAMKISQQYYTTSKLLFQQGKIQVANYMDFMQADVIYQEFHKINEVRENFKRIYAASVPFSVNGVVALQGNNYLYDESGDLLEMLSFEWIDNTMTAEIEYAIASDEAKNTKTVKING